MKKIAVLGDIMLDEYLFGGVSRISPEAPIPIVNATGEIKYVPGGCGNVANNIASLGHLVTIYSICGDDKYGFILYDLLNRGLLEFNRELLLHEYKTTVKERIIGNGQQIIRIDSNDKLEISHETREFIVECFKEKADDYSIVIISDYGKGLCDEYLCQEIIRICNSYNIPVIVDPKGNNWCKYRGAYMITPNVKELCEFAGESVINESISLEHIVSKHIKSLEINNLLVTRSEQGMSLFSRDGRIKHVKALAREVFDVSGAGDTVVAAIAVWLCEHDGDIDNALDFANVAAGIVVGKRGTSVVTKEEISDYFGSIGDLKTPIFEISQLDDLRQLVEQWRKENKTIVTTNGCFDILHRGHIYLLSEAKKFGDKLIVCINSDASIKRIKGENRPVNSETDRAYLISAIKGVDAVIVFDEHEQGGDKCSDAPITTLRTVLPDIHVKGGDYTDKNVPEARFAKRFVTVEYVNNYSTTSIINKVERE